ncbi:MAG: hypothetical protein FWF73_03270 [Spirochaetes bacterium]|nr:hypothetical protein [Spirochaetota bacterium]
MKIIKKTIAVLIAVIILLIGLSCLNSPKSVYERMLRKYDAEKGDDKSDNITQITNMFLIAFSKTTVNYEHIFFNKSIVISLRDNIEVVYPEKIILQGDESIKENISFADMNKDSIVLGNNKGFCIFNDDGNPYTIYKSEKKERIDAIALKGKDVVYLSNSKMFKMSHEDKEITRMDSGEYSSPYKKYFKSSILVNDQFIVLNIGIAGSYYISVFDASGGNSLMKNISASSLEFNMKDINLLYVRGATGKWSVEKYEIPIKKRDSIKNMAWINNIFIAEDGFIVMQDKNCIIEGINGDKGYLPHDWNIIGICRNMVLIEYGNVVYLIDFPVLLNKIIELNKKIDFK